MFVNIFSKTIFNAVAVWGHCAEMSFISVNKCSLNTDAISTCRFVLHYIKLAKNKKTNYTVREKIFELPADFVSFPTNKEMISL